MKEERERKESKKSRESGVKTNTSKPGKGYPRRGKGQEDGESSLMFQAFPRGCRRQSPSCEEPPGEQITLISVGLLGGKREKGEKREKREKKPW